MLPLTALVSKCFTDRYNHAAPIYGFPPVDSDFCLSDFLFGISHFSSALPYFSFWISFFRQHFLRIFFLGCQIFRQLHFSAFQFALLFQCIFLRVFRHRSNPFFRSAFHLASVGWSQELGAPRCACCGNPRLLLAVFLFCKFSTPSFGFISLRQRPRIFLCAQALSCFSPVFPSVQRKQAHFAVSGCLRQWLLFLFSRMPLFSATCALVRLAPRRDLQLRVSITAFSLRYPFFLFTARSCFAAEGLGYLGRCLPRRCSFGRTLPRAGPLSRQAAHQRLLFFFSSVPFNSGRRAVAPVY